jgi:hypothetical protein
MAPDCHKGFGSGTGPRTGKPAPRSHLELGGQPLPPERAQIRNEQFNLRIGGETGGGDKSLAMHLGRAADRTGSGNEGRPTCTGKFVGAAELTRAVFGSKTSFD